MKRKAVVDPRQAHKGQIVTWPGGAVAVKRQGHDERRPTVEKKKENISLRLVSYGTMYLDRRTAVMSSRKHPLVVILILDLRSAIG